MAKFEYLGPSHFSETMRRQIRKLAVRLQSRAYEGLSTREVFERVYKTGAWGAEGRFNSGTGSCDEATSRYIQVVKGFIRAKGIRSVVDLGCGDFRVGSKLIGGEELSYIGIDIVRPLVQCLTERYEKPGVRFLCRDILEEEIPEGDLYLIRQVLQHLSNEQIEKVLDRLSDRRVIIVTEHLPLGRRVKWNKDKAAGPDIRLYYGSGVFLEHPPFCRRLTTLLEVPLPFNGCKAVLRTSLLDSSQK
jgi:SAM-dependent methyltransferase